MTNRTLIERLSDLQYDAECFREQERALAELTAELDEVAQRRADAQERVEKLRPSAELLTRANTVLDELLKSHEDAQTPSRFAGLFDSLFGHVPAGSMTGAVPADEPAPVAEPIPEEPEPSAEPEDVPQPDPVLNAPPAEPAPAGQEEAEPEADAPPFLDHTPPVTISVRVREYLEAHPGTTVTLTAAALGVPRNGVGSVVARMLASGEIEAVENSWPPMYKLKGSDYTLPVTESESEEPTETELEDEAPEEALPVASAPQSPDPAKTQRDASDRQAIQSSPPALAPLAPTKVKPITESDEHAVLSALLARPNGKGSAALLSGKARMATSRVTEVLEHLAEQNLVIRPEEGEFQWRRA